MSKPLTFYALVTSADLREPAHPCSLIKIRPIPKEQTKADDLLTTDDEISFLYEKVSWALCLRYFEKYILAEQVILGGG